MKLILLHSPPGPSSSMQCFKIPQGPLLVVARLISLTIHTKEHSLSFYKIGNSDLEDMLLVLTKIIHTTTFLQYTDKALLNHLLVVCDAAVGRSNYGWLLFF